jgi:membrane-associated PAP2 superfamily phosphatase
MQQFLKIKRAHKFKIERDTDQKWRNLAFCSVAIFASCVTVSLLKDQSIHGCPWDLAIYQQIRSLPWHNWQNIFERYGSGQCFPAGHASIGFLFMHFALLCTQDAKSRDYLKRKAKIKPWFWVSLGLILGLLLGVAQQMRGAHFMSHTIATMFIHLFIYGLLRYLLIKNHQQHEKQRFIFSEI